MTHDTQRGRQTVLSSPYNAAGAVVFGVRDVSAMQTYQCLTNDGYRVVEPAHDSVETLHALSLVRICDCGSAYANDMGLSCYACRGNEEVE